MIQYPEDVYSRMTGLAKYAVKSIETAFRILNALKDLDGDGVSEHAAHLDIRKARSTPT
jgi:hypothetical protein